MAFQRAITSPASGDIRDINIKKKKKEKIVTVGICSKHGEKGEEEKKKRIEIIKLLIIAEE